ncbi:MAG: hypothetical protein AVDCRST_MAG53-2506 [uncultured Solirubrobacteraceae bacterium]|uniref:Uncharacterized protein n=1 Tax=uncultured Solirubrobacteraceae bacterium TaxID=1162706 RepID=A0A6J4SWZ0_9ACTN|nr:MAG: hypothetical protein AVDCRST_MAG53-2506 [uncultured Solirubrobacteraceae bacterium]
MRGLVPVDSDHDHLGLPLNVGDERINGGQHSSGASYALARLQRLAHSSTAVGCFRTGLS